MVCWSCVRTKFASAGERPELAMVRTDEHIVHVWPECGMSSSHSDAGARGVSGRDKERQRELGARIER